MNTNISVTKSIKSTDTLVLLTDRKKLDWATEMLNKEGAGYVKKAAKKDINSVFIPRQKGNLIVQFLNSNQEPDCETDSESLSCEDVRLAGNDLLTTINHYKIESVVISNVHPVNMLKHFVEGLALGNYQFIKYFKDKSEKEKCLKSIKVMDEDLSKAQVKELQNVISATFHARDLVNEPLSFLTAPELANQARVFGKKYGFKVTVFDKKKIEKLKMGGLLAVNRGSNDPPTFSILEWKPAKVKNKKPIVLVGKGIVYDTGGVSLKPTANSMDFMKSDMGGAATVIGSMVAITANKLPLHVIALVPSTDNRPGKDAYVPGDVIKMFSGDTVEVLNTDAEGRLVLADALHYAKRYQPELVLDFATLTGAAARAIGSEGISYMGTADNAICNKMETSGFRVYERLVRFPLWREYRNQLNSNIADIKNLGGPSAGMITAGKFLEHFTDFPWLHFDIAGSAYLKMADGYRTKEGTGVGVRLVYDFLKNY